MRIILFALVVIIQASVVAGPMDSFVFENEQQEAAFNKLSNELRCLVCQNQAIADSNADLAQDLRKEIHTMIVEGKSEEEIVDFMVERYGDYVLYRPPFKPVTWLLWFGPVIAFVLGVVYAVRFLRSQKSVKDAGELSDDEIERLRNLQSEIEATGKEEDK